jgi:hypothetical protein
VAEVIRALALYVSEGVDFASPQGDGAGYSTSASSGDTAVFVAKEGLMMSGNPNNKGLQSLWSGQLAE